MKLSSATEAARNFLSVVWDGPVPRDAEISEALDRLIAAYYGTSNAHEAHCESEPPEQEYDALYKQAAARFPNYGLYPVADPAALVGEAQIMTGDAVDDLVDLTLDMRRVTWFEENAGVEEAISSFRQFFFHWGRHAREFLLYLHARQFD